jgi:hypothetical protein
MDQKSPNLQPGQVNPEQLPVPINPEELSLGQPLEALPAKSPEVSIADGGAAIQGAYAGTAIQPVVLPAADDPSLIANNGQASTVPAGADIDVIEKEWVEKAKTIVARTKDDPHVQAVELSTIKREYVKNRFGKILPDNKAA